MHFESRTFQVCKVENGFFIHLRLDTHSAQNYPLPIGKDWWVASTPQELASLLEELLQPVTGIDIPKKRK